jgi:4-hydroxy-tetrahydrodipicolinate reductase
VQPLGPREFIGESIMPLRIILAGATGWVGRALVEAIAKAEDLELAGAVSRSAAGRDAGEPAGIEPLGVTVSATLDEALRQPADVVIDYTNPQVVKGHALAALAAGRHVVIGTSGLSAEDYAEIDSRAREAKCGVLAAGNFSITATLLRRFAVEAARYVPDVEIIDYASPAKADTPSGTARELAELLGGTRQPATSKPVAELTGVRETRGGAIGAPRAVQVHSLRMPSFVLSCEVVLGADNERLTIRHDAGASAAPYVAGTLLATRRVGGLVGLTRGLDMVMGS